MSSYILQTLLDAVHKIELCPLLILLKIFMRLNIFYLIGQRDPNRRRISTRNASRRSDRLVRKRQFRIVRIRTEERSQDRGNLQDGSPPRPRSRRRPFLRERESHFRRKVPQRKTDGRRRRR